MSDINFIVILYSKYSSNSKKLLDVIRQFSLPQFLTIPFKEYCIDNKQVRKMIIDSSKFSVSFVPAILIFFRSGYIEKYEGEKAFQWTSEIINSLNLNKPKEEVKQYDVEQDVEEEVEEVEEVKKPPVKRNSKETIRKTTAPVRGKTEISTLLSLDSDLEDEEFQEEDPSRNEVVEKSIKKDTGIMARAMEIQKMRDEVEIES